ncbi:MAG: histidinol dehydrogenase, partial [Terrimicrobiaceae bacterium]
MRVIRPRDREYDKLLKTLNRRYKPDQEVRATVAAILESVAREGDDAVVRFTREFGGPRLDARALGVGRDELDAARIGLSKDVRKAILSAKSNVRAFAKRGLRKNWFTKNRQGAIVGERFDPFPRVGIYVPGGTAPLVSTAVMTCTLAAAAGVAEIVAVTPPER